MIVHNIINVLSSELCGAEKVVCRLHAGLLDRGVESRLIAIVGDSSECSFEFESLGLRKDYGLAAFSGVYNYIKNSCSEDDIVHAHLFPTMLYVSLAARLLRWKGTIVCTEHSTNNRRRGTTLGKVIDWQVYAGYSKIYCISSGVASSLSKWIPRHKSKLTVVENGAELAFDVFETRDNDEKLIITSVGRLHPIKNYPVALKALSMLEDIDFEYRIAGGGNEESRLGDLCEELGLSDCVKFLGYVQDVPDLLRRSDLFLITSLWEGFGLAAVEAMNAGLPVIASDVPGLAEIVDAENKCGVLVDPENPSEIASAITELVNRDRRMEFGKNGFDRSLCFSKERMIDHYVSEYKKIWANI